MTRGFVKELVKVWAAILNKKARSRNYLERASKRGLSGIG
jgi:hypothetical protein